MVMSTSPCIGRASLHQGKKGMEEQVKFEINDDLFFFFNIQGIVQIDLLP
jgi:hypothetical protein